MAKRHIIPMGKHKPVRSSWAAMDTGAYSRSYEPETRPEFRVYVTGQADAMLQRYNEKQAMLATQRGLDILRTLM